MVTYRVIPVTSFEIPIFNCAMIYNLDGCNFPSRTSPLATFLSYPFIRIEISTLELVYHTVFTVCRFFISTRLYVTRNQTQIIDLKPPMTISTNKKHRQIGLPQELYDNIMFYLRKDNMSLKNCSLVCRSWVGPARAPLFRTLTIGMNDMDAALLPLTEESTWPSIASYVRNLRIPGTARPFPREIPLDSFLHALSPTITHLHLSKSFSDDFEGLMAIVCMFSGLQFLVMDGVDWDDGKSVAVESSQKTWLPQSLSHLELYNVSLSPLMQWLLSHPRIPTISHFDIGPIRDHEIPMFGRFLTSIGPNLDYLAVSFESNDTGALWSHSVHVIEPEPKMRRPEPSRSEVARLYRQIFGLPTYEETCILSKLRTLRVNRFLDICRPDQSAALFWVPRSLTVIQSSNITSIALQILNISRAGDLDKYNFNWNFIDRALNTKAFRTFHVLEFQISGKVNLEAISSLLSLRLPGLASRNLLRFSKIDP